MNATCNQQTVPDNKVHGANMGPIWGRQDPGGPHVGPMNLTIWGVSKIVQSGQKLRTEEIGQLRSGP